MSNRFHNKWHRHNHHTVPTTGEPDSSHDPIASPSDPFQGSFVVNGPVSSNNIVYAGEGDSSKWNNTYSTVNANSSMWMGVTSVNNMGDGVNIVAGPNINITNNASSKTITVSASAPSPISTYVRTFNNMDGNVKIAEGPNIKLITNPSTKTVTISSKSDGGVLSLNELDGNIELIAGTNINIQKNDSNKSLSISAIESDEWSYNKKLNFNPHVGKLNKNIYPVYSNISNTSYSSQIRYAVDKGLTEYIFYVSMPSDTIHDTSVYCGFMNERDSNKYYLDGNPLIVPHMAHQSYPIDIVFVSQDALILKSKVKDSNVIKYYLYELDGTFNSHQFIEANAIDITSIIGAGQEYILQYDKNNGSPRLIRFELADSVIDDIRYKDTSIAVFDAKTLVMKGNPITFFRSVSAGALFHMTTALDGPYADNVSTYQSPIESQRYPITFNKDYTRSDLGHNASFFQYYFIPESFNIIGVTPFRIGTTGGVNYFINADAVMHFKVPSTFLDMGLNSIDEITPISDTSMEISDQGPFLTVGDVDTRRLVEIPGSWARSEYGNISNLSSFNYTGKNAVKIYDYDPVSKNLYLSIRTDGNKMVKLIYNNIDWNTFVFTATAKYDKLIEINPPILIPYGLGFMHQTSLLSSNFGIFDCRGKAINGGIYTDEYQFITAEISPQRQLISSLTSYNISAWNLNLIPNSVKPLQMCVDNNIIPLSSWFMVPTTFRQYIAWPFISTTIDANGKTHRYIARNAPNDSSTKVYEISAVNHSELGMVISGVEIMDMPTPRHPSWVNYYSSEQPELIKQLSGSYVTNYAISGNNIIYVIGTSRAPNVKYPVTMNDNRDINDMFPNRTYVDNVSSTITGVPSEVLLNNNDYVYWLSGINTPVPSYAPALSTIVMEQNYWKLNDSPVPGNVEVLSEDSVRREFSISATQYKWDGMQRLLIYDASKPEFYLVNSPVASASFVELQKMDYNNDDIMGAAICGGTLLLDLTQNHLYCTMVHSTNSPSPMVWDLTNQKDLTNYNKNYADPTHFGVLNDPEFNIGKYMTGLFGNQNISNKIPITNIVMVSEKDANGVNLPDTLFNLIANGNATTNNLSNKNVNILSPTNHSSFDIYVLKYPLFLDGKFWDEEELFKTSRDYYTLTLQPNTTSNIYLGTTNTINGYDVTVWADSEDYLDSFNRIKIATIFTNENGIDDNRTILYNINGYNIGESLPLQSTSTPITTFNGVATASNTFVKVTVGGKEYGILLWNLP